MKKLLLGAAALAITAGAASAAEWSAKIGGTFTAGLGYVDNGSNSDVGVTRDTELAITGKLVADNGITFGAKFELESDDKGGTSNFDEVMMYVEGSFGRVEFGEEDGAQDKFGGSGIVGCEFVSAVDECGMLDKYGVYAINTKGGDTGDSLKITYYTPNFSGFMAGVSFVPKVGVENGTAVPLTGRNNAVEVGAQYKGDFSGFGLTIGGGWTSDTTASSKDDSAAGGGVKISVSGFTAGVNYGWREIDDTSTLSLSGNYKTGPWTFGAAGVVNLDSDSAARDGNWGLSGEVAYALAPGVNVGAGVAYYDPDRPGVDAAFELSTHMGLTF